MQPSRERQDGAGTILVVDDDAGAIQLLGRILAPMGDVRFATSGEDALSLVSEAAPDVILLDADMPGLSGFEVCRALKADAALAEVPVIFVTSHSDLRFEVAGFEAGAADFIAKPVSPPIVRARVRTQLRMKHMADELRRLSATDGLTGLANRRRFDETLAQEWRRAQRSDTQLALLLVDVDHFKLYNDRLGHPAGDACLRQVAEALQGAARRPTDLVARYGGEEFALLLPATDQRGAEHVGKRVLAAVESLALPHPASPTAPTLTVSIGAGYAVAAAHARHDANVDDVGALVQAADRALYLAKHRGRAQLCSAQLEPLTQRGRVDEHAPGPPRT